MTLRLLQEGLQTRSYTWSPLVADNDWTLTSSHGVLESEDSERRQRLDEVFDRDGECSAQAPATIRMLGSVTTSVDPGGTVTVTIRADNYGGLGRVVETLPSGFTSPDASWPDRHATGYCRKDRKPAAIRSPLAENLGSYTFSGVLEQ